MTHRLQLVRDNNLVAEYPLIGDEILIGRSDECQIRIQNDHVGRRQALLVRARDKCAIEDLGSKNRTRVNGLPVSGRTSLHDGDRISFSGFTLLFCADGTSPSAVREENELALSAAIDASDSGSSILGASAERRLQAVLQILEALGGTLDLGRLLDATLGALLQVFPAADRGLVLLEERGKLVPKAARQRDARGEQIGYSRTLARQALDMRQAILMHGGGKELPPTESMRSCGIRSAICAPMFTHDQAPLGVLQLDSQRQRRGFDEQDLHVLTCVAAPVSLAIGHARTAHFLRDLKLAEEVQRGFLPQEVGELGDYRYWGHCRPARSVGGDFYDFFALPNGNHAVLLGDVAGKGLAAALMMAKAATICRVVLRAHPDDVRLAMGTINREVHDACGQGRFVTCILGVVRPRSHEVTFASAGHMSPLVCRSDGGVDAPVATAMNGLPLGIVREFEYETVSRSIAQGEGCVLYSDGVSEALNAAGTMYSAKRIAERLAGLSARHPAEVGRLLIDDLQQHVGDEEQGDDISVVVFGRNNLSET
jgi:serine phosphatase RsbU (regulator of sigma subunit)